MHVILSTVLQAFRFTHETPAEASYGEVTAYTGKLHSLLRMTYVANTEPHLRLLANVIELSGLVQLLLTSLNCTE